MKIVRISLLALMAVAASASFALAQDKPAPVGGDQPTPRPEDKASSGTEPGGAGSTGWTGGTGGAYIGTTPSGTNSPGDAKAEPNSEAAPEQPETVQGANPDPK